MEEEKGGAKTVDEETTKEPRDKEDQVTAAAVWGRHTHTELCGLFQGGGTLSKWTILVLFNWKVEQSYKWEKEKGVFF